VRRVSPGESRQARAMRADRARAGAMAEPSVRATAPFDLTSTATPLAEGGRAVVGMPPTPPPRPATVVEARQVDRGAARDRRAMRPDARDVVAAQLPDGPPAPIEAAPPVVTASPPASTPPTVAEPPAPAPRPVTP